MHLAAAWHGFYHGVLWLFWLCSMVLAMGQHGSCHRVAWFMLWHGIGVVLATARHGSCGGMEWTVFCHSMDCFLLWHGLFCHIMNWFLWQHGMVFAMTFCGSCHGIMVLILAMMSWFWFLP